MKDERYIYEVLRIIDGKPLYMEQHYNRLIKTLILQGVDHDFTQEDFNRSMLDFVASEGIRNDNVELILHSEDGSLTWEWVHRKMVYPSAAEYENGVPTELLVAMRDNPHAKVHNRELRARANQIIAEQRIFEVILVDYDGNITEGSRSNIFFVKDGKLYTSPAEGVLLGVTRQQIISVCEDHGIHVIEKTIAADSLNEFDAAFVSGTSPKVLPIYRIGDVKMDVTNETLRRVMRLYDEDIAEYLRTH